MDDCACLLLFSLHLIFFCTEQTAFYIMLTLIIYHHVVMFKIQIAQNNSTENKTNILGFTPTIMYYCMQMLYLFISQQKIWIITTHFSPILVALQITHSLHRLELQFF